MTKQKKKPKQLKVYFCPKCKSTKVFHPFRLRNLFGVIPRWECRDCNFQSAIFPIGIVNVGKLNKKIKSGKKK